MPKTRSRVNTSGSGQNAGGAATSPNIPRSFIVSGIYSRTRGNFENIRVEFEDDGRARVHSASGQVYTIENGHCSCPHHVLRGQRCRHLDALDQVLGYQNGNANTTFTITPLSGGNNTQSVARESLATDTAPPVNFPINTELSDMWFSRNYDNYKTLYDQVQPSNVTYLEENVLNDPQMTFGLELEVIFPSSRARANCINELYQEGLLRSNSIGGYHSASRIGYTSNKWSPEYDGSLDRERGVELVSPILRDNPESWRSIKKMCEIIKRHGGTTNQQTGGHIHVSNKDLGDNEWRWKRLAALTAGFENVFYRLAPDWKDHGKHRGIHYTRPYGDGGFLRNFFNNRKNTINTYRQVMSRYNRSYSWINTDHEDRVEFRVFNGTLEPEKIQANIALCNATLKAAAYTRKSEEATRERHELFKNNYTSYNTSDTEDHRDFRNFLDLISPYLRKETFLQILLSHKLSKDQTDL